MNFQQEISRVRKGQVAPIYLVLGTEPFFMTQAKQVFMNEVLPAEERAMNLSVFNMTEHTIQDAIEEANAVSFFSERKIICVDAPFFLTGEKPRTAVNHDVDNLLRYLQQPNPQSTLVFFAPYEQLDNRKKIVKTLMKQAVLIEAQPLNEKALTDYILQMIAAEGHVIDRTVLAYFLQRVDYQLSAAVNELTKIFLYCHEPSTITKQHVDELVARSLESNVFRLTSDALEGKTAQLINHFRDLMQLKEEPLKLHALLIGHFRLLIQLSQLASQGYQASDSAALLKIHPYRVKLAWGQQRQFSSVQLMAAYRTLVDLEYALKGGTQAKEVQFELSLLQLVAALHSKGVS